MPKNNKESARKIIETNDIAANNISDNSSPYVPFARKYRPSDFSEICGQEVLVKTLNHCIIHNRIAQSYLLTGIRGVGKTSTARIIAKTLNCDNIQTKENIVIPCKECKNCKAISEFNHPDIVEMDAASHTSIEGIRKIIMSSEYKPLLGKYKVFIIDEVHMLSKSAFNALLKLLEEPPMHAVFILATTEMRKIPLTVISRCQRFDLKRFSFSEILDLLGTTAKKEKVIISDQALKVIAVKSEGSARDAISLLDQAVSFAMNYMQDDTQEEITEQMINDMLGLVQHRFLLQLIQYIVANDTDKAIKLLNEIYSISSSLEDYMASVTDFIAELTKEKIITTYHNPIYASFSKEITDLLIGLSPARLSILWQIFSKGTQEIKHSHNELNSAEMTIIKAICASNMPSMDKILAAEEDNQSYIQSVKPITTIKTKDDFVTNNDNEKDIFSFLRYCHSNNELDAYYSLLNDVEIKSYTDKELILSGKLSTTLVEKVKILLGKFNGHEYIVKIVNNSDFTSLKEKMIEEVKASEDFNVIKNKFPRANISDILLGK